MEMSMEMFLGVTLVVPCCPRKDETNRLCAIVKYYLFDHTDLKKNY